MRGRVQWAGLCMGRGGLLPPACDEKAHRNDLARRQLAGVWPKEPNAGKTAPELGCRCDMPFALSVQGNAEV